MAVDLDCLRMLEGKRKIANSILDDYSNLQKVIEDIISNFRNEKSIVLESIDTFINQFELIKDGKYLLDGKIINLENLIIYFENYNDTTNYLSDNYFLNDEYEYMYEGEELENLLYYFNRNIVIVLFYKWNFLRDNQTLNEIIDFLKKESFLNSIIPACPSELWINKYDEFINNSIDTELAKMIVNIDYFYSEYMPYISKHINENGFIQGSLFSKELLYSQLDRNVTDLIISLDDAPYDLILMKPKYNKEDAKLILSDIDLLYEYCSLMTNEESMITAKYAYNYLVMSLELLNTIKILFKELKREDFKYEFSYKFVRKLVDKIAELTKLDDCLDSFASENAQLAVSEFFANNFSYINTKLLMIFATDSLDELVNLKKEITLLYKNKHPNYSEEIEKNVDIICERITGNLQQNDEFLQVKNRIMNTLSNSSIVQLMENSKVMNTLSTAELLYQLYIVRNPINKDFDYSIVSCNYYKSIEILLNELVYVPYRNIIQAKITAKNYKKYLGNAKCGFADEDNYILKDKIELGPLGYLLKSVKNNASLSNFLNHTYGISDFNLISKLGMNILKIKDRRNNVMHNCDTNDIEVKEDKFIVYDFYDEIECAHEIHNLFTKIIKLF